MCEITVRHDRDVHQRPYKDFKHSKLRPGDWTSCIMRYCLLQYAPSLRWAHPRAKRTKQQDRSERTSLSFILAQFWFNSSLQRLFYQYTLYFALKLVSASTLTPFLLLAFYFLGEGTGRKVSTSPKLVICLQGPEKCLRIAPPHTESLPRS